MAPEAWADLVKDPAGERHIVQVYRERGFLVRAVAAWIAEPLRHGGGTVLACSQRNLDAVVAKLREDGVDVDAARREGRFVAVDAEEFLAKFMRDGDPRADLFKPIIGEVCARVRAHCAAGTEIRAWGEMVDILVKRGQPGAAARLEAIWNEVIDEERIRLLCSYELDHLKPEAHAGPLHAACAGHSRLIAEEDLPRFETALDEALVAEYGEAQGVRLRIELAAERTIPLGMAASEAVVVALQKRDPVRGARVLAAVERAMAR